jgi:hypothetical protein
LQYEHLETACYALRSLGYRDIHAEQPRSFRSGQLDFAYPKGAAPFHYRSPEGMTFDKRGNSSEREVQPEREEGVAEPCNYGNECADVDEDDEVLDVLNGS